MAFLRIVFDKSKCTDCGMCRKSCPTQHNPIKSDFLSKSACIACGTCTRVCPKGSLNFSVQLMGKAESVRKRVRGVNGQKFAHRAGNEQIFPLSAEKPTVQLIQK
jgi:ferredoxin